MGMERVIDISTPLDERTPYYPGDHRFRREMVARSNPDGTGFNLSLLGMSAHSGTHMDAPCHFIADGKRVHEIDPARFVTPALVAEFAPGARIDAGHIAALPLRRGDALLLKANATRPADAAPDDFVCITAAAAQVVVDAGVHVVGIDALSIEAYDDPAFPVHRILLGNDVLIVEGLRLAAVAPGRYTLVLAPLLITDGDGAPARALLLAGDERG